MNFGPNNMSYQGGDNMVVNNAPSKRKCNRIFFHTLLLYINGDFVKMKIIIIFLRCWIVDRNCELVFPFYC